MNVDTIFHWLRLVALVILDIFGADEDGRPSGEESVGLPPGMKPERIQFWVRLIARFVLEVFAGASGETGKSGETEVSGW